MISAHGLCHRLREDDASFEARERVFSRFHRELGSGIEGSGLGLSIVAEALQRLGGTIVLDASPALGGLRATVTLPVAGSTAR